MNIEQTYSLNEIDIIAKNLCDTFNQYKIWIFQGNLGAGKTTLIQRICNYLGVQDVVNSPSFSLVQIYQAPHNLIYHMDLYRLKSFEEALHIGIEDMLLSKDFCFIEWAEIIMPLLNNLPHITIQIEYENHTQRKLKIIV